METVNKRIKELREKLNLNRVKFAKKIGFTGQFISALESEKTALTEANIRLICFTFGVNEEWLRNGTGEMMDEEAMLSEREKRLLELFRRLSPRARDMLIEYAEKLIADEAALRGELNFGGER